MFGLSYIWNNLPNFRKYNRVAEKTKERKPSISKSLDRHFIVHSVVVNKIRLLADKG